MSDALTYLLDTITRPAQDRTERYMRRLESHLAGLPEAERAPFVAEQIDRWCDLYAVWCARMDNGTASATDQTCTPNDYLFTILALRKKARELAKEQADA